MHAVLSGLLFAFFALHNNLVDAADVIAFTIPSTILPNASQVMDPRYAGFGIEFSNVFSFTGTAESPNTFSSNLLQNLKTVAGVAPCIRIGGNTQDNALYQSNFSAAEIGRNQYPTLMPNVVGYVPFDNDVYGPELFKALGTFPAGTQFIYGLNLAYDNSDYLDVITTTAKAVISALDGNVYSFEIGNEPDLYSSTAPYRIGQNWSGVSYVEEWVTRSAAIQSQVCPYIHCETNHRFFPQLENRTISSRREPPPRPSALPSKLTCWLQTTLIETMPFSIIISTITFTISKCPITPSLDNT